jgi:hypothetical protein
LADTLRVALATLWASGDISAASGAVARSIYRRALRTGWSAAVELADLAVDGEELMQHAGITRGPALGASLRHLLDVVLDEPTLNTRDALLAAARAWQASGAGEGR